VRRLPVKVLYVAGVPYSSTTLIGNAIGQVPDFFYGGELRNVWKRGFLEDRQCGCGVPFTACPLWTTIRDRAFGSKRHIDVASMSRIAKERSQTREALRLCLMRWSPIKDSKAVQQYAQLVEAFYRAIQETVGCGVIVDSSKSPAYAHFLDSLDHVDVYVVHVIRDPRGSAYSCLRRSENRRNSELIEATFVWDAWHVATERLFRRKPGRYLCLRYEDFVADPRSTMEAVLELVGSKTTTTSFITDTGIHFAENHTFSGNRNRFRSGLVELQVDSEWIEAMGMGAKSLVTGLTLPLLARYHYPLWL
jgi:hypothetical protein